MSRVPVGAAGAYENDVKDENYYADMPGAGADACRVGGLAASAACADVPAASARRELFRSPHAAPVPYQNSRNYITYGIGQPSFNVLGNPLGLQPSPDFPHGRDVTSLASTLDPAVSTLLHLQVSGLLSTPYVSALY